LAPGGPAALDRIQDVTRELARVYGPGVPGDVVPGQFRGERPAGYPGAPGDEAPGGSPAEALGGYPGGTAGLSAAALAPDWLSLACGVSVLSGGAAQNGPQADAGPAGPGGTASGPEADWTVALLGRAVVQAREARQVAALLGGGVRGVGAGALGSVGP